MAGNARKQITVGRFFTWLIKTWPRLGLTIYGGIRCGYEIWTHIKKTEFQPQKEVFIFEYRLSSDNRLDKYKPQYWAKAKFQMAQEDKQESKAPTIH